MTVEGSTNPPCGIKMVNRYTLGRICYTICIRVSQHYDPPYQFSLPFIFCWSFFIPFKSLALFFPFPFVLRKKKLGDLRKLHHEAFTLGLVLFPRWDVMVYLTRRTLSSPQYRMTLPRLFLSNWKLLQVAIFQVKNPPARPIARAETAKTG